MKRLIMGFGMIQFDIEILQDLATQHVINSASLVNIPETLLTSAWIVHQILSQLNYFARMIFYRYINNISTVEFR